MSNHRHPPHAAPEAKADKACRESETGTDVTRHNVQTMHRLEEAAMARRTLAGVIL